MKSSHIILSSHPNQVFSHSVPIHWGAKTARERGPIIATLTDMSLRNVIGTHGGSYSVYRALATSAGGLPNEFKPDLTNTAPAERIGPFPQWSDPDKIVAIDPWGADIFEEFKNKIYTRKINKFGEPLEIKQKEVDSIRFLRNQNSIAFCTKEEFFNLKGKLLQPSKTKKLKDGSIVHRDFGIPQGSPISSVLANIYLLHFDKTINDFISSHGGIYRRYSDDMVVVCPLKVKDELSDLVYKEIGNYKLEIQPTKTQVFQFKREKGKLLCGQEFDKVVNWNTCVLVG